MPVLEKPVAQSSSSWRQSLKTQAEPMKGAFFWLTAFYVIYCARPEDWIPGLSYIPLAKISGAFALFGLLFGASGSKRSLSKLPREAFYLIGMIALLFVAAALSPVWKGGAFFRTLDFSKVLIVWALTYVVITSFQRLRKIMYIQSASVAVIAVVSLLKGHDRPRLEGVIGGIYSNPNDLAFAIVLSLPFLVAFLLDSKKAWVKIAWLSSMLAMFVALFMTASRGGFVTLVAAGAVALWHFGVKGKRPKLIVGSLLVAIVVGIGAGGRLKDRFVAISGEGLNDSVDVSAHGSYEQRMLLMKESLVGMVHYPFGIGLGNFTSYSGEWREVHMAYLEIAVEGGFAAGILYLLFFWQGFANLRRLRRSPNLDPQIELFAGALHSSLVGFVVGALFAPEAYQFFPYFAVAYTSVLLAIVQERQQGAISAAELPSKSSRGWRDERRVKQMTPVTTGSNELSAPSPGAFRDRQ